MARTLLNLASERGRVTERGTVIDMRLTQQELAELAGMTRETMARTLREFQQAGCIRVEAGIISILAVETPAARSPSGVRVRRRCMGFLGPPGWTAVDVGSKSRYIPRVRSCHKLDSRPFQGELL